MTDYLDKLKDWERDTADPAIYSHIDSLFPGLGFVRVLPGTDRDHWASPLKMDGSRPKIPNREKTVVYASDWKFREQGEWENAVSILGKYMQDHRLGSVYEAYMDIASRLCLDLPASGYIRTQNPAIRDRKLKLLEELEKYFAWNLANNSGAPGKTAREYLSRRGFSWKWIECFRFGLVPPWEKVEAYITSGRMGFSKDELEEACMVRSEDGYTTVGRKHVLAIPYRCSGELKGFLFRAVDPDVQPKYKASTGLGRTSAFFNMPEGLAKKSLVIVEGEMDALSATCAGIEGVVAIGGSDLSGNRKSQIIDALNRNTVRITLCLDLDSDADGNPNGLKRFKAVRRCLHSIFDVNIDFNEVYIACFPEVCDPNEYIIRYGADAFRQLLSRAVPWWEYLKRNLSGK